MGKLCQQIQFWKRQVGKRKTGGNWEKLEKEIGDD